MRAGTARGARSSLSLLATLLWALASAPAAGAAEPPGELLARAVLPADTTAPGPPSGSALGPGPFNGVRPPFPTQPVQGFSGILPAKGRTWLAMPDNGYGRKENSADWLQRIYRVGVRFERAPGEGGAATVRDFVELSDPKRKLPFALVRADRLLTGADIDPESIFEARDGTFWVGDEFGPWLLHFDRQGRLLDPPLSQAGVRSPQNPDLAAGEEPTLGRSKGFEASAPAGDGRRAYAFLEGPLLADPKPRRRYVYELDLVDGRFTGRRWEYRTEDPDWLVADAKLLEDRRLLVMERDDFEGAQVRLKKVYEVDLDREDDDGFAAKRELVDLLDMRDRDGISLPAQPDDRGLGHDFSFPLRSVESIWPLSRGRLVVANDNNYPFDAGRHDGVADGNEWIIVRPAEPDVTLARGRIDAAAGRRFEVRYELARDASLSLELRRGGKVVSRQDTEAQAGRGEVSLRAPGKPGRYRLRIVATLGNATAGDRATLIVD